MRSQRLPHRPPNAFQANICGALGCNWKGDLKVLLGLKARLSDYPGSNVVMVGIQESCYNQFLDLESWLKQNKNSNFTGSFHTQSGTAAVACNNKAELYGVGVFTATIPLATATAAFPTQDGGERRGYACIRSDLYGSYWGCSAHMTPNTSIVPGTSLTYGEKQFQEYVKNVVETRASSTVAVLWGGDLYTKPNRVTTAVSGFSYSNHLEADRCASSYNNWTHRHKSLGELNKFDWNFRSGRNRSCAGDATFYPLSNDDMYGSWFGTYTSDHRIEMGAWN